MPANVYSYSVVTKIGEGNTRVLYEALTRPLPSNTIQRQDFAGVNKARAFYASCQNQRILNQKGTGPLLLDINAVGGWDALDNWDNATFDLDDMLFKVIGIHSTGALFSVSVQMDPRNYSKSIIVIDQDGLTLPGPEYYLNAPTDINAFKDNPDQITRQYRQLIQSVITLLGGRPNNPAVEQILLFERKLAHITIPSYDPRRRQKFQNDYYIRGSVNELKKLFPNINWYRFLERVVGLGDTPLKNFPNFEVLINAKDYLDDLRNLISQTSDQTLHNYLLWRIGSVF